MRRAKFSIAIVVVFLLNALPALSQAPAAPKEIFRDSDGNLISNNEFVDIRVANSHYPDATVIKILPDGTKEFRLQKIAQEGMPAPEFSVRTLDGRPVSSADLRGKVVVLNFWFIGCPACRAQKPKLNQFKTRFAGEDDI